MEEDDDDDDDWFSFIKLMSVLSRAQKRLQHKLSPRGAFISPVPLLRFWVFFFYWLRQPKSPTIKFSLKHLIMFLWIPGIAVRKDRD